MCRSWTRARNTSGDRRLVGKALARMAADAAKDF
jgi:hypothetical protein